MYLITITIISFFIIILLSIVFSIYNAHKHMVKEFTKTWGYSNFEIFINEYNKRRWIRKINFPSSHFGDVFTDTQIHADIIMFDGKGMILDFWSYWKYRIWLNNNRLKRNDYPHVIWQ